MKTIKNVLTATLLLLLFAAGCEKKEKETETEKKPCSCENPLSNDQFSHKEAYLFKDSISMEMLHQIWSQCGIPHTVAYWIIYDSEIKSAELTVESCRLFRVCAICNFTDFAEEVEEWDIPENGCKVYFEGITYKPCGFESDPTETVRFYDYKLTNLEKR